MAKSTYQPPWNGPSTIPVGSGRTSMDGTKIFRLASPSIPRLRLSGFTSLPRLSAAFARDVGWLWLDITSAAGADEDDGCNITTCDNYYCCYWPWWRWASASAFQERLPEALWWVPTVNLPCQRACLVATCRLGRRGLSLQRPQWQMVPGKHNITPITMRICPPQTGVVEINGLRCRDRKSLDWLIFQWQSSKKINIYSLPWKSNDSFYPAVCSDNPPFPQAWAHWVGIFKVWFIFSGSLFSIPG